MPIITYIEFIVAAGLFASASPRSHQFTQHFVVVPKKYENWYNLNHTFASATDIRQHRTRGIWIWFCCLCVFFVQFFGCAALNNLKRYYSHFVVVASSRQMSIDSQSAHRFAAIVIVVLRRKFVRTRTWHIWYATLETTAAHWMLTRTKTRRWHFIRFGEEWMRSISMRFGLKCEKHTVPQLNRMVKKTYIRNRLVCILFRTPRISPSSSVWRLRTPISFENTVSRHSLKCFCVRLKCVQQQTCAIRRFFDYFLWN